MKTKIGCRKCDYTGFAFAQIPCECTDNKQSIPMFFDKAIRIKLGDVYRKWVHTLHPELKLLLPGKVFIAGGAIASLILGEEVNDYDIYFTNMTTASRFHICAFDFLRDVDKAGRIQSRRQRKCPYGDGVINVFEYKNPSPSDILAMSKNAITFRTAQGPKVQTIVRQPFVGDMYAVVREFDFVHTQGIYYPFTDELFIGKKTLKSIQNKKLIPIGTPHEWRIQKFLKRGWTL